MKIRDELLKENSLKNSVIISEKSLASEKLFDELMECFLSSEYRVAQKAAAVVRLAVLKNPAVIVPYLTQLVSRLSQKNVHNAVIRNAVRILQEIEIPEEFHAEVINRCFSFIENPHTPVAIKAFSLTTLYNLSKIYPDLKMELRLIIEDRFELETPAFKSRAGKILNDLNKL